MNTNLLRVWASELDLLLLLLFLLLLLLLLLLSLLLLLLLLLLVLWVRNIFSSDFQSFKRILMRDAKVGYIKWDDT